MDLKTLLLAILFLSGCQSNEQANSNNSLPSEQVQEIKDDEEEGVEYSDSMISAMVSANLPKPALVIDTFQTLQFIECDKKERIDQYSLSIDSINKYENQLAPVSEELKEVLQVSHCFSEFKKNSDFQSFIFYSQFYESHYSVSFDLVVVPRNSKDFEKIVLAVEYRNEQGQKNVSAQFLNDSTIVRTTKHKFRYIHGIGKVDSTSIFTERIVLHKNGEIVLQKGKD